MDKSQLIGAWSLQVSTQSRNGEISKTFGDPPSGQLLYSAAGRMSGFLMDPAWVQTGVNACKQADIFFAYGGRWEIIGQEVHHHVDFCSAPSKIGNIFVRTVQLLSADEMELTTAPEASPSGNIYQTRLIWKKLSGG